MTRWSATHWFAFFYQTELIVVWGFPLPYSGGTEKKKGKAKVHCSSSETYVSKSCINDTITVARIVTNLLISVGINLSVKTLTLVLTKYVS